MKSIFQPHLYIIEQIKQPSLDIEQTYISRCKEALKVIGNRIQR